MLACCGRADSGGRSTKNQDRGYLGRILMLTLLAPDIVEAIMDGRQPAELGVHVLREGFPVEWGKQRLLDWQRSVEHRVPYRSAITFSIASRAAKSPFACTGRMQTCVAPASK